MLLCPNDHAPLTCVSAICHHDTLEARDGPQAVMNQYEK